MAARGLRALNGKEEKIEDPDELAQVRRQARWVHIEAVLFGVLLTAISIFLPVL